MPDHLISAIYHDDRCPGSLQLGSWLILATWTDLACALSNVMRGAAVRPIYVGTVPKYPTRFRLSTSEVWRNLIATEFASLTVDTVKDTV